MGAGDCRYRLRFERERKADDGYGNETSRGWEPAVGPVSAGIRFVSAVEAMKAGAPESLVPCVITIRDSAAARTIDAAMRAVDAQSGRTYRITAVMPRDQRSGLIQIRAVLEQPVG